MGCGVDNAYYVSGSFGNHGAAGHPADNVFAIVAPHIPEMPGELDQVRPFAERTAALPEKLIGGGEVGTRSADDGNCRARRRFGRLKLQRHQSLRL